MGASAYPSKVEIYKGTLLVEVGEQDGALAYPDTIETYNEFSFVRPHEWVSVFAEDFESPTWLGEWGNTSSDFFEDFESNSWIGLWCTTVSDFFEDFQSWPTGPL
jgi:hypothetical protein